MSDLEMQHDRRRKIVTFVIHLLCLVILFVLPEVLFSYGRPHAPSALITYGKAAVFALVFYVEYYCLIPFFTFHRSKIVRFVVYNLLLVAVGEFMIYGIMQLASVSLPRVVSPDASVFIMKMSGAVKDAAMLILTITLAVALRLTDNWIKNEARRREEESVRRRQELERLRNQLNPHFLFNTLNSIYALIAISPADAQDAVHKLSKLLRYVLYENPAFVSLECEAAFMDNYVKLQRLRLPKSAVMELDTEISGYKDTSVPPMLFVTLLENVFKHADFSEPCTVALKVKDNFAIFTTENKIRVSGETKPGIGLENLCQRLALLYGDKADFSTHEADGKFYATLSIPLTLNS